MYGSVCETHCYNFYKPNTLKTFTCMGKTIEEICFVLHQIVQPNFKMGLFCL